VVNKEDAMDDPPMTPADPAPRAATTAAPDAYLRFWDCVENDIPSGDDTDDAPVDAYDRFWELNDA
jgi:hypothetical protein